MKLSREELITYIKLVALSLIYVLPIMIADRYYNDDLARALYGATGWKGDGRPLGEYIILGLCEGAPVVDIAPLPLILSVLILSYSLILYAKTNLSFMNSSKQIIVLLLIIINPFAISNLSYQFDCIIMFTAISLNFFIYAMPDITNEILLFVGAVMTGILIMSSYQATIGISLVLFLVNVYFILLEKRKNIRAELVRIIGIIFGAVIYKLSIARYFVSKDDWRMEASQMISGLSLSSVETIFDNIRKSCEYILQYYLSRSELYQLMWLGVILGIIMFSVVICYSKKRYVGIKKIVYLFSIAIFPIAAFFSTFLPLMVLNNLTIKSRIFIAFSSFIFFIGILLFIYIRNEKLVYFILGLCIFFQYTYIFAYGNAMASQKEYEEYMAYAIVHDVENINCEGHYSELSFIGAMPRSRQLQMMCEKYSFFEEIVPVYFGNSTWIEGVWPYYYMQEGLEIVPSTEIDENIIHVETPRLDNYIYSCYLNDEKIIIRFKERINDENDQ